MLKRRLRGLGVATLVGSATWALLGLAIAVAIMIMARLGLISGLAVSTSPHIPGGLVGIFVVTGAIVGAVNGLVLGLLVLAAERGRALERIPWWRFGAWGAVATGATAWLLTTSPIVGAVCASLGGLAGIAALALAKRAPPPQS